MDIHILYQELMSSIERPTIIFNITYENRKIETHFLHTSKAFNSPCETYSEEFF